MFNDVRNAEIEVQIQPRQRAEKKLMTVAILEGGKRRQNE